MDTYNFIVSSSTNPWWDPATMPSWNKTTDCLNWDVDYHPCPFPFFGLDRYGPDASHCHTKFSEAYPDAYMGAHVALLVCNTALTLLYGSRALCCLVDTDFLPLPTIKAWLSNPIYKRDPKPNRLKPGTFTLNLNVYDYCNFCMLATCLLQVVLSCDVEGWDDRIPYKPHVITGIVSQNIAVMTGIPITVNWINLIHVWSDPFKNRNSRPPLGVIMRNTSLLVMWLVSLPVSIAALFFTKSCDDGCENGTLSCVGKAVFTVVLITLVLTSSYYAFRMYLVLKSDDKFNLRECLFPWCADTNRNKSRSKNRSSSMTSSAAATLSAAASSAAVPADSESKRILNNQLRDSSSAHESSGGGDEDELRQRVVWDQIRKIWKIVLLSVLVSVAVIQDNFSYCFGRFGTIKYENPPCSAQETVTSLKMMWLMLLGSVVFLLLIPSRQEKQSAAAKRVLVERIKCNSDSAPQGSRAGGEVALGSTVTSNV